MKSKNVLQTRRHKIIPWLPVLLAFSLTFICFGLRIYTNNLRLTSSSIIYLVGITNFDLMALATICINAILIVFYLRESANVVDGTFPKLGLAFLLFLFSIGNYGHRISHKNSLMIGEHVYHLAIQQDSISSPYGESGYVVLECDSTGVSCRYFAKPFTTTYYCFRNLDKASLEQNSTTHQLVLIWNNYGQYSSTPVIAGDNPDLVGCNGRD